MYMYMCTCTVCVCVLVCIHVRIYTSDCLFIGFSIRCSLSQIERKTGRRITDLFDWIVATSTGALIALGLVYCEGGWEGNGALVYYCMTGGVWHTLAYKHMYMRKGLEIFLENREKLAATRD